MPELLILRVYYFFAFAAFGLYLPFYSIWLQSHGFRGLSMSLLAMLLPLLSLTSPPLMGMLSDKLGIRAGLMTITSAMTALAITALGLAGGLLSPLPFWAAFTTLAVFGAFRAPAVGLADVLTLESGQDYARVRLWGSAGFLTSALIGGKIIDPTHPYSLPLAAAACLWVLSFVSLFLPRVNRLPPRPALSDARQLLRQSGFRWMMLMVSLFFLSMTAYDLCASLRLKDLGASSAYVGAFWALATAAEIVLLYFVAPSLRRFGPGKLLTLSALVTAGRWVFLSEATSLTLILALQPLHAFSFGLMLVSAMATLKREVGERGLATAQGLYVSALAVGATIGLFTWGIVWDSFGSRTTFQLAAAAAGVAALSALPLIRWSRADVEAERNGA